ncbi:MAG: phosphonate ABC transporter, permease protein PhnE [Alcaligenaceae bacterium]|nr:phosphonate ABC transporter, permease protein PhnE [Alcaligenaceae bacterium SAGV5]MPS54866.1 phosphonate ABC transporter, permease protein PhnE [Alcaligenaceae bacterium SAGV3]MPT56348.1 phosphonate ABC transporter, permease protein PhnE [Alcaligenaceae bacterium]
MGRMLSLSGEALLAAVGLREDSQVLSGFGKLASTMFPLQVSERTEVARIEDFDRNGLPWFSHLETIEVGEPRLNPDTLAMEEARTRREYLVEPLGYLRHVAFKMLETIEIAFWATLLAVVLSAPLAWCSARNFTSNRAAYVTARGLVSLMRAVPELISALFLVLAYGFGPIAGVLALALHSCGFLGKFYAEDIETADDKPQEALRAIGAGKLKIMRFAVLPQVMPQFVAYTLYVLDRNVRMATVVGLVGAGGIGQELKGRYDMYQYAHVGTILVAIFITVFLLDQLAARLRKRLG